MINRCTFGRSYPTLRTFWSPLGNEKDTGWCPFRWQERFERERRTRRERENSPTPPVVDEVGEFEWQQLGFCRPSSVGRGKAKALVATEQRRRWRMKWANSSGGNLVFADRVP